jgi:hypothetical protein
VANLTEVSIGIRKLAFWAVVVFLVYLIFRVLAGMGISYWQATHRPPPPPPNVLYGKLPTPKFPANLPSSQGLKFILENVEGAPPESTPAGKVYYMPKKLPSFLSPDRAQALATRLEFTLPPKNESVYFFYTDENEPLFTLSVDSVYINFQLKYDYKKKPEIFNNVYIPSREQALSEVKNFINYGNLFDESISGGKITSDLLRFDPGTNEFTSATSVSTASAVRINYFRNDLDRLAILPPGFSESYNYAIYSPVSVDRIRNILEISYTFWPINTAQFATYPLKSAATAFQELVDGKVTVMKKGENVSDTVTIRKIYLAYYDSEDPQLYLQPIFVFEGDNGYVAYDPAISPDYLE